MSQSIKKLRKSNMLNCGTQTNKQTYKPTERCSTHPKMKKKECERVRDMFCYPVNQASQNIEGAPVRLPK